jgi:hypothetical protein
MAAEDSMMAQSVNAQETLLDARRLTGEAARGRTAVSAMTTSHRAGAKVRRRCIGSVPGKGGSARSPT